MVAAVGLSGVAMATPCGGAPLPDRVYELGADHDLAVGADITGDGRPDLVLASRSQGIIEIYEQQANGAFEPAGATSTVDQIDSIAVSDLTGDGVPEVVVATEGGLVSLVFVPGDTFGVLQLLPGAGDLEDIEVVDVNGDGLSDVVAIRDDEPSLFIALNAGDGTVVPGAAVPLPPAISAIDVADTTGDGHPDVTLLFRSTNSVKRVVNNGDGTFGPQELLYYSASLNQSALEVEAADVDADGDIDLALPVDFFPNGGVVILENSGGVFARRLAVLIEGPDRYFVFTDLNGDGLHDVLALDGGYPGYAARINAGDWSFSEPMYGPKPTFFVEGACVADFDGDGLADVAVLGSGAVALMLGASSGPPFSTEAARIGFDDDVFRARIADVNLDGVPDIVASSYYGVGFFVLLGAGDGTFADPIYSTVNVHPYYSVLGDFVGDPGPDVLYSGSTLRFVRNHGDGRFLSPREATSPPIVSPTRFELFDLDSDTRLDAVVLADGGRELILAYGRDNPTHPFEVEQTLDVLPGAASIELADLDCDGDPDIVIARAGGSFADDLSWHENLGGRTFADEVVLSNRVPAWEVGVLDTDADGDPDVVGPHGQVLLNDGFAQFYPADDFDAILTGQRLELGDLDGDGRLDLFAYTRGGHISVRRNASPNRFELLSSHGTEIELNHLQVADLDGDLRADLIAAGDPGNAGSDTLSVLFQSPCPAFCPADLDRSGLLNFDDIDAFVVFFLSGDPAADLTSDGYLNIADVDAFVGSFLSGCG